MANTNAQTKDCNPILPVGYTALREQIYESMLDVLQPEYRLPGIESLFSPGTHCDKCYSAMYEAYERLRERLGVTDEDDDIEMIISSLTDIGNTVAY